MPDALTRTGIAVGLTALGFGLGALPFAVWLGRLVGRDVRAVGDANPGAVNAFRAGGPALGVPVLVLDFLKGALPVFFAARILGPTSPGLVAAAVAPVFGHACSPFLGWRGGKAVAVTFGIWAGLTLWRAPTVLGVALLVLTFVVVVDPEAWRVMIGMLVLGIFLVLFDRTPARCAVVLLNGALLAFTHRAGLRRRPRLRLGPRPR